jgi:hypothetical protein
MKLVPTITPPCILCGGRRADVVGERDRQGNYSQTVLCSGCGLVSTEPRPAPMDLAVYYQQTYRLEYKGARIPSLLHVCRNARVALARFETIRRHIPDSGPALDVGSVAGEFEDVRFFVEIRRLS